MDKEERADILFVLFQCWRTMEVPHGKIWVHCERDCMVWWCLSAGMGPVDECVCNFPSYCVVDWAFRVNLRMITVSPFHCTLSMPPFFLSPFVVQHFFTSAEVLCQFFDAFRREFDLQGTHKLHEVIRLRGVHNYFQSDGSFEALEKALNRDADGKRRQFDHSFFRQLIAVFFGRWSVIMGRLTFSFLAPNLSATLSPFLIHSCNIVSFHFHSLLLHSSFPQLPSFLFG